MRNDLTPGFLAAMGANHRAPIQLIVFHFPTIGDIFLSDRDCTIGGQAYTGLVENWGVLNTAGYEINDIISETLEITVSLWNGGNRPFSNYFLVDEPTNVAVDIYQTFEGLPDTDKALIGQFVIQDPIEYSESNRLIALDLVSPNMRYTANIGPVLTTAEWPNALEADLNKGIDLIVGDAGEVKTICAKTPLIATMKGSILKLPTIINTYEDLDELDFPQTGYLVLDDEILHYSARDNDTFTVDLRGTNGTIAADHSDGVAVLQYITDHTYIIGQGPLTAATEVKAGPLGNRTVEPSEYTLDLDSNPATITFPKQPSYISYPKGARSTDVDFDITLADNTAYQPHYSYDVNLKALGAIVNKNNRRLSVANNEIGIDEGEVVRVFLTVEHWATKLYANDQVIAYADGIGEIGRLSRPNASDIIEVNAEVDLDHGHGHRSGGNHDHAFGNPGINTSNPSHTHSSTLTGGDIADGGKTGLPYTIYNGSRTSTKTKTIYYNGQSNIASQKLHIKFYSNGLKYVKIYTGYTTVYWYNNKSVDQLLSVTPRTSIKIVAGPYVAVGGNVKITKATLYTTKKAGINSTQTAARAYLSSTGDVVHKNADTTGYALKSASDVYSLIAANKPVDITSTSTSSKKVTDKFDITKHLETADWNWLVNKRIYIEYTGANDDASIFITYVNFEVEYRQRQTVLTNDIYLKPVGSIENRPDAVLQYILNHIAGIPLELFGSIWAQPNIWRDTDIWDDTDIWIDNGEAFDYPPGAAFQEAGARYSYLGYRIDGVISANKTVQAVAKEICKQARGRLLWSGGQIKLAVREKLENWVTLKSLDQGATQLRSISAKKEPITNTYNDIDLFYKIDRKSMALDESRYNATASLVDTDSVNQHGQRKDNSEWLFDLVRDDAMAADLVDYYLWRYGQPLTKYSFNVYLQQFDTEKDDTIRLTSDFSRLNQLPLRISNNARTFGNAKVDQINTIELIGESIRHNLIVLYFEDHAMVVDDIEVNFEDEYSASDTAGTFDEIAILQSWGESSETGATDEFQITIAFKPSFTETVAAADTLAISHTAILESSVSISEDFFVSYKPCFGACGFGGQVVNDECGLPFGAVTEWFDTSISEAGLLEEFTITAAYSMALESGVTVSDSITVYDNYSDNVGFSEELIFNSCFGCPVAGATGFGQNNFGK